MKVQVEKVSPVVQRLSFEVEPAKVEKELTQAYTELSRSVKMPGFRPGKIPRRMLEGRYKGEVEADVVRRLQMNSLREAIQNEKVPAIGEPRFTGGKIVNGQPLVFSADCDVRPDVVAKEWKGLKLTKRDASVPDTQVEEQVQRLRESKSSLEVATGRDVVKTGDWVTIDFDATIDGKPFTGNTGRGVTVEVAPGELIQGNLPQLDGAKLNTPTTFDYTFPADYRVDEVKGQKASFTATVKEIKAKQTPPLDDALAKLLGADTVDDLRGKVRKDLERGAKNRTLVDERDELFKALIEKNPFEVPKSLIDHGIDVLLDAAFGQMFQSGIDPRNLSLDWSKLREELRPKAESESRGQLLLEAIAKQEKIEATDGDLDAKLASLAEESGVPLAQMKAQYKNARSMDALKQRVVEEKVMAVVKSHASFS